MVGEKERQAVDGILRHMELVHSCSKYLATTFSAYLDDPDLFRKTVSAMREVETEADEARRHVELIIYSGAFLPIHREDYLDLAELIDKVADDAVAAINVLSITSVSIPKEISARIKQLIAKTIDSVTALRECIYTSFEDRRKASPLARRVEQLEEAIDQEEFDLRSSVFSMEINGYDKIILNDLVEKIGNVSDSAEDVTDRIVIIMSKRE